MKNVLPRHPAKLIFVTAISVATVAALSGCAIAESLAEAHTVEYRVTVEGTEPVTLASLSFRDKEVKNKAAEQRQIKNPALTPTNGGAAQSWATQGLLNAGDTATLTAQPGPGATATCWIGFDGGSPVITKTGEAGASVTCEALVPGGSSPSPGR